MSQQGDHRTTARILDILECIAENPEGMSLATVSRTLGAPKSSVHPLISTLVSRNYLKLNEDTQRYHLGEQVFILGNRFVNDIGLMEEIHAITSQLSMDTGETIYFGILSGLDVLYLIKSDQYSNFRVVSNPGHKLPAYATGYGKSLLSQFSPEQIRAFYPDGTLHPITEHTLKDTDSLNEQLEKIRQSGFSYESEESTPGIQCVGAPVRYNGKIIAGISIAVPKFRYTAERETLFKPLLVESVRRIENAISKKHMQWNYT